MHLSRRKPSESALSALRERARGEAANELPTGLEDGVTPSGFRRHRVKSELGDGIACFDAASVALRTWQIHRDSGLSVSAEGPPSAGATVALAARLPLGYAAFCCRVLDHVETETRYAFSYKTMPGHPEQGVELFEVELADDGRVTFTTTSVSQMASPLSRIAGPLAWMLQGRATMRYHRAAKACVGASCENSR